MCLYCCVSLRTAPPGYRVHTPHPLTCRDMQNILYTLDQVLCRNNEQLFFRIPASILFLLNPVADFSSTEAVAKEPGSKIFTVCTHKASEPNGSLLSILQQHPPVIPGRSSKEWLPLNQLFRTLGPVIQLSDLSSEATRQQVMRKAHHPLLTCNWLRQHPYSCCRCAWVHPRGVRRGR